jgi:hypothetical protein
MLCPRVLARRIQAVVFVLGIALGIARCGGTAPSAPTPPPTVPPTTSGKVASPPPAPPLPTPPPRQLTALPCADEGRLRSVDGVAEGAIQFVNASGARREVYWLDYNGNRQFYQRLESGQSYLQPTYVTHPWVITDGTPGCVAIFLPEAGQTTALLNPAVTVTRPSLTALPCADEPLMESKRAEVGTAINFVSQSPESLRIYWIDYNRQRVLYATLAPMASHRQPTYVTHPWLVADANDRCKAIFQPTADPADAVIR